MASNPFHSKRFVFYYNGGLAVAECLGKLKGFLGVAWKIINAAILGHTYNIFSWSHALLVSFLCVSK